MTHLLTIKTKSKFANYFFFNFHLIRIKKIKKRGIKLRKLICTARGPNPKNRVFALGLNFEFSGFSGLTLDFGFFES